jgi:hypothetical protein
MSFNTYGALRTHFLALLNRDDCTTALADTFLAMGIKRACRGLRIPEMESQSTLVAGSSSDLTIPATFLEMKSLFYGDIKFTKDEEGNWRKRSVADGSLTDGPIRYIRQGSKWYVKPSLSAGAEVTLTFYASFSFSSPSDTHAVLGVAGDLLVYAALVEAGEYFLDERTDRWNARYQTLGEELNLFSSEREMHESDLVISSGTSTEF